MARILKIDIQVDESGEARRRLEEVDKRVDAIDDGGRHLAPTIERLNEGLRGTARSAGDLSDGLDDVNTGFSTGVPLIGGYSAGMVAATAAAAGLLVGLTAVVALLKESADTYIEQSQVLEINRDAVDNLADTWERAKFRIGEALVGNSADFRSWIDAVSFGLDLISTRIATEIEQAWKLYAIARDPGGALLAALGLASAPPPGVATQVRDINGELTAFGRMQESLDRQARAIAARGADVGRLSGLEAERITLEALRKEEAEHTRQLKEQERAAEANARMHRQLAEDLNKVLQASREAYDVENQRFFTQNAEQLVEISGRIRQNYAEMVLSQEQLKILRIEEEAAAARREVLNRGTQDNTEQLLQQIEAERQLRLMKAKAEIEGITDELRQQFLIFRDTYSDILDGLPLALEEQQAPIAAASADIRETLVDDLEDVQRTAVKVFDAIDLRVRSSAELLAQSRLLDYDAERNFQRGDPFGVGFFQAQQAASLRTQAGQAAYRESLLGFAEGGIVPRYLASGGFIPRGTDTVPAMLTPGELVLTVAQQDRLARAISSGMHGATIHIAIDARGARFTDDQQIEDLAERIQRKLQDLYVRVN